MEGLLQTAGAFLFKGDQAMGMSFENIHFRKNEYYRLDLLIHHLTERMQANGYVPINDGTEGDVSINICEPLEGDWVSIASELFLFRDDSGMRKEMEPFARLFHTDVIGAFCCDSDFLVLNLLGEDREKMGKIVAGSPYAGWSRRGCLTPWKSVVRDFESLKLLAKDEYCCTEELFSEMTKLLNMTEDQAFLDVNSLFRDDEIVSVKLSFRIQEKTEDSDALPKLKIWQYSLMPCVADSFNCVYAINTGGSSRGIGVMFYGDFAEKDELTFRDVSFRFGADKGAGENIIPVNLEKVKLKDGKYAYYWTDKEFMIPAAVSKNVPEPKREKMMYDRSFGVFFTPQGNTRKLLDIKVVFYPLANPRDGQTSWMVYSLYGSKEKFIEGYNAIFPGKLKREDFD